MYTHGPEARAALPSLCVRLLHAQAVRAGQHCSTCFEVTCKLALLSVYSICTMAPIWAAGPHCDNDTWHSNLDMAGTHDSWQCRLPMHFEMHRMPIDASLPLTFLSLHSRSWCAYMHRSHVGPCHTAAPPLSVSAHAQVGLIGKPDDLTYEYTHLGTAAKDIKKAAGSDFVKAMREAARPMVVVGPGVLQRSDAKAVMRDIFDLTTHAGALPCCFGGAAHMCFRMCVHSQWCLRINGVVPALLGLHIRAELGSTHSGSVSLQHPMHCACIDGLVLAMMPSALAQLSCQACRRGAV